ncbi:MAG: dihydrodipicolinate synthase family protein [Thermomicrobiales bacterium]
MTDLRGCIPILCTPFHDDHSVDYDSLEREVDWVLAEGAAGVATLALASEGYKLNDIERVNVADVVINAVAGRVPVVVSADGPGHAVALYRARSAEASGASALMVLPPYFVTPDLQNLYDYYRQIGEAVSIPVMIQDAPQLTKVSMSPSLWAQLAADVPTIRYVKAEGTPGGPVITETRRLSEDRLQLFCGWGGLGAIDAFERGAVGSMPAPNFTRLFADVQSLIDRGDTTAAEARFDSELPFSLWAMQSIDFSVAAAKAELHARGVIRSTAMRQPATALDDISQRQLARWIARRF